MSKEKEKKEVTLVVRDRKTVVDTKIDLSGLAMPEEDESSQPTLAAGVPEDWGRAEGLRTDMMSVPEIFEPATPQPVASAAVVRETIPNDAPVAPDPAVSVVAQDVPPPSQSVFDWEIAEAVRSERKNFWGVAVACLVIGAALGSLVTYSVMRRPAPAPVHIAPITPPAAVAAPAPIIAPVQTPTATAPERHEDVSQPALVAPRRKAVERPAESPCKGLDADALDVCCARMARRAAEAAANREHRQLPEQIYLDAVYGEQVAACHTSPDTYRGR